jgi:hypothetical protein
MSDPTREHLPNKPDGSGHSVYCWCEGSSGVSGRYLEELVQVAAVAVAMIEDHLCGVADRTVLAEVITAVTAERQRQNTKWGPQHHGPAEWLAILMEEVGEAAQAALQTLLFPREEQEAALRAALEATDE